jgi:hypothetical protein
VEGARQVVAVKSQRVEVSKLPQTVRKAARELVAGQRQVPARECPQLASRSCQLRSHHDVAYCSFAIRSTHFGIAPPKRLKLRSSTLQSQHGVGQLSTGWTLIPTVTVYATTPHSARSNGIAVHVLKEWHVTEPGAHEARQVVVREVQVPAAAAIPESQRLSDDRLQVW